MRGILDKSKWWVAAALFSFCVAPTFISYQPYLFAWDDADFLLRSIAVSRAFWSGNLAGLGAMISTRPPAMTWMGLPWGWLASWDAAGNCFITLAAVTSLVAAACLYLLLRMGVKPLLVAAAGACVWASLGPYASGAGAHGPYPGASVHWYATAFLADGLFAWTTLAAVLLIPYEARTHCPSIKSAVLRGILWGSILSLGAMTKLNFLYFVALIVPALFLIRLRNGGLRSALAAFAALAYWSAPAAMYLVRCGRPAFEHAKEASFGRAADFYYIPPMQFLGETSRESPGLALSFLLTVAALTYAVIQRRRIAWEPDFLAVLIVIGFGIIVLAAPNREIRFEFPAIVALPFLAAILLSGKERPAPGRFAALAAGLVFCGLLAASVPTRHRAVRQSLVRPDAVLAEAAGCHARRILLATDSPTLNEPLMDLAIAASPSGASFDVSTLAYRTWSGAAIEFDYQAMRDSDEVVFQDRGALYPPFTNQRVSDYERYMRQGGYIPVRRGSDLSIYSIRCRP